MATIFRIGLARIVNTSTGKVLSTKQIEAIGVRCISGKTLRSQQKIVRPPPYPYQDKKYIPYISYFLDSTTKRFDENTKIVVVEGPPAAGKSKFAKKLAEELDMMYLPEANLDMLYYNSYGYDLRKLDDQMPDSCKSFDINNFLMTPKHRLTANFQILQYYTKFSQYIDALAHLLSTGQGVVLDRCAYSDFVFAEAMYQHGYISKPAWNHYYEIRNNTIFHLLKPHLVVYLDVPVPKVLDNVRQRNFSYEVNSQVMNPHYLQSLEMAYKQKYLKEMSKSSELLIYDWSEGGDADVVVEDIERIDFNRFDSQDTQLKDWEHLKEESWADLRLKYCEKKPEILSFFNIPPFDVPELVIPADEALIQQEVLDSAPGNMYAPGFNADMGDKYLFKILPRNRCALPVRERRDFTAQE